MVQLRFLLLSFFTIAASSQHVEDPEETDVESPSFCTIDDTGFGGRPLGDEPYAENTFFYELTMTGENLSDVQIADNIFECEVRMANFLLNESPYFGGCINSRRLQTVTSPRSRRLQADAVAITTNPPDEPLDGYQCTQSTVAPGETCLVLEGAYRVYFEQGAVGISSAMESMEDQVEEGMDNDAFVGGNILKVVWKESLDDPNTDDTPSEAESPTVPSSSTVSRNSNAPAIIGASVGGILALGMVAFYRRRNVKATDDDTFTTPSGVNSAV